MDAIINFINSILWDYILVYGLLAVGIFFTFRLGFLQFRYFPEMFRNVLSAKSTDRSGITPFQALCTSLASRVGTGNIAGVAVALYIGGPGAIFWMWMVALVGMATAYAESTLAQLYKVRDGDNHYRGGPAFYIARGLKAHWAGVLFSVCLILAFGLVFNAVQANSIADSMEVAFGLPKIWVGVALAVVAGIVVFGGISQIANVAQFLVPFMAVIYLLVAIFVIATNFSEVPGVFGQIFSGAFGLDAAAGGIFAALLQGVRRGLFSNEAGMGSAPNIAAAATPDPHHPSSQGFVQALGVFIDTLVICTATALMILLSSALVPGSELTGTPLTQAAMTEHIGVIGTYFVAIAILFFAFTSIIGNYAYAESAMVFIGLGSKAGLIGLRIVALGMVIWGAYQSVSTVFNAADAAMGLMATVNLVAIVLLSGTVVKLTRDYTKQRDKGIEPVFHAKDYPELANEIDSTIWDRHDQG
ncbi:alanine/glycine:cation symporter family protein [Pelagibacterium sp.]|uniref:alanine/glycine:cation symporter family protein n=1 Tax=Pelagibacterium sp. TaxID=1967288 RepID=UPI003A92F2A4